MGLRLRVSVKTDTLSFTEEYTRAGFGAGGLIPEPPLPSGRYTMLYRNEVKLPQTAKNFLGAFRTEPPPPS